LLLDRAGRAPSGISAKSTRTALVSDADRAADALVVERLHAAYPDDAIVSEEGGQVEGRAGRTWYVDPLDGTINYRYAMPHWSVSIACADRDGALAGVVFLALVLPIGGPTGERTVLVLGGWALHAPPAIWYAISLLVIVATTHAVNLSDGLDGLAAGTVLPPLAFFAALAWRANEAGVTVIVCALAGAVIGFLAYNRHPAKVFMGDTGSLALGGVIAGAAILTGTQLLLPLVGGVFAAEALSVILQVAYFKRTSKRIFRMSPLHHHFELGGWPETKVTRRFWAASALLSAAGLAIAR